MRGHNCIFTTILPAPFSVRFSHPVLSAVDRLFVSVSPCRFQVAFRKDSALYLRGNVLDSDSVLLAVQRILFNDNGLILNGDISF
ncbi:MAG: hypothetical protein ACLUUG_12900 [Lachnospiraceae bacterium]